MHDPAHFQVRGDAACRHDSTSTCRWITPVHVSSDALTLLIIGSPLWRCRSRLGGWSVALWWVSPRHNHVACFYWFVESGVDRNSNTSVITRACIGEKIMGSAILYLLFPMWVVHVVCTRWPYLVAPRKDVNRSIRHLWFPVDKVSHRRVFCRFDRPCSGMLGSTVEPCLKVTLVIQPPRNKGQPTAVPVIYSKVQEISPSNVVTSLIRSLC